MRFLIYLFNMVWKIKYVDLSRIDDLLPLELSLLIPPALLISCSHRITEMMEPKEALFLAWRG